MTNKSIKLMKKVLGIGMIYSTLGLAGGAIYHSANQEFLPSRESIEYQEYIKSFRNLEDNLEEEGYIIGNCINQDPEDIIFDTGLVETQKKIYKLGRGYGHRRTFTEVNNTDSSGDYTVEIESKNIECKGFKDLFYYVPSLKTKKIVNGFNETTINYRASIKPENRLLINRMSVGAALGFLGTIGLSFRNRGGFL